MAGKRQLWREYKKVVFEVEKAKKKERIAFGKLFKEGDEIKYRRKTEGSLLVGKVYMVNAFNQRVKVINLRTGAKYWVEIYWIEGVKK